MGLTPDRPYDRTSYVLVVDDDNTLLKFFKIHLNKFFSKVIVVKNAKEAIDNIRSKNIDLVITDIRMPRMDGTELMKKIRAFDASIPILLISGAMLSDEQIESCERDADGFLRKPFSVDDLHAFIDNGMKRRDVLRELAKLVSDNKSLTGLLAGELSAKEAVQESAHEPEAKKLLNTLKAS